jgi:hypothetical protein
MLTEGHLAASQMDSRRPEKKPDGLTRCQPARGTDGWTMDRPKAQDLLPLLPESNHLVIDRPVAERRSLAAPTGSIYSFFHYAVPATSEGQTSCRDHNQTSCRDHEARRAHL